MQVPQLMHALAHGDELAFGAAERDEVLAASFKAYGSDVEMVSPTRYTFAVMRCVKACIADTKERGCAGHLGAVLELQAACRPER